PLGGGVLFSVKDPDKPLMAPLVKGFPKRIAAMVEFGGFSLEAAAAAVLDNIRTLGGKGGLIAVDTAGRAAIAFTTRGMFRGLARQGKADRVAMFGPPGSW
ncbi:MAG: isoaspartyl peptidase/L-asparaginase, partial [Desulfovibrionales bacterium]